MIKHGAPRVGRRILAALGVEMGNQEDKQGTRAASVPMDFEVDPGTRHLQAVAATVVESQRPTTRKVYTSAWARFEAWARQEGVEPLPAEPVTVAAYLVHRAANGLSLSSLALDRKAISYFHRQASLPTPTASEGVRRTVAGLRNRAAERGTTEPRQATGLREADLQAIVATAHSRIVHPSGRTESAEAARLRGPVDIAIASVMRDAMLRRQEAANLRWGDVEFRPDGSSRIIVRRSKTSNQSAVLYVGLHATAALRRKRSEDAPSEARVFGVQSGRTISRRIAAMCRQAGLGEGYTGHSPRVGMTQDLTASGFSLVAIMNAGRWKSKRMPAHYARGEAAGNGAIARYYEGGR